MTGGDGRSGRDSYSYASITVDIGPSHAFQILTTFGSYATALTQIVRLRFAFPFGFECDHPVDNQGCGPVILAPIGSEKRHSQNRPCDEFA